MTVSFTSAEESYSEDNSEFQNDNTIKLGEQFNGQLAVNRITDSYKFELTYMDIYNSDYERNLSLELLI